MGKTEFNKDGNSIHTISTLLLQIAILIFLCSSRKLPLFQGLCFPLFPPFPVFLLHPAPFIHSLNIYFK